jgi:acyl carrier protein
MGDDTIDRVREIAADLFGVPLEDIGAESSQEEIEAWDSLAQLNLMLALEDEFTIRLAPGDIEKMSTVSAIAQLVDAKLA